MYQVNIHMKHQALYSSKDKGKQLKCCLLQFLFSALWVRSNCFIKFYTDTKKLHYINTAVSLVHIGYPETTNTT